MFEQTTPLHRALNGLKGPLTAEFDVEAWRSIAGAAPHPADERLLRSAIWIAEQASTIREKSAKAKLLEVGGRRATILAIASMTRETLCVMKEQRQNLPDDEVGMSFDYIVSRPKFETGAGAMSAADDVIEMVIGSAESWIFDAYNQPTDGTPSEHSVQELIVGGGRIYSLQRSHADLWNQARWDGWGLDPSSTRWQPADKEFSTIEDAWRARAHANSVNHSMLVVTEWDSLTISQRRKLALKRTIESIRRSYRGLKINVGRPTDLSLRKPPLYALDLASLEGSYLGQLIEEDLPKAAGLNAGLLLKAWHVCTDLAKRLMAGLDDREISERLEDFALLVPRPVLVKTLASALEIEIDLAERVVEFLTYRTKLPGGKGQRGLWAAPLIEVPGGDEIGISAPALNFSFILRRVEAWFEKGGLDDQLGKKSRGETLERAYREKLALSVQENELLTNSLVAPLTIKKTSTFPQQIDLLFRLGDLLVVGEVKHRLFPSDSMERFNYFQKLKGAAEQAKVKAQAISDHPETAAAALGLPVETIKQLRVLPLVVVNQGFGLSLMVDDVRVTETMFLDHLLGDATIVSGMSFDVFTGERIFAEDTIYESEKDLVERFQDILADPWVLRRYISRMGWRTYEFPQASGGSITIEAPLLGDITGEERGRAEDTRDYLLTGSPRPRGRS